MTNTKHKEKIKDIMQMLMSLLADMEQEDYEQENYIKLVPRSERILSFPAAEQNNQENENKVESAFLQFTDKEIKKMPKQFRPIFKTGKVRAHIRKTKSGSYQIRIMINGNRITATDKNLETAKQIFLERLYNPEKWARERRKRKDNNLLGDYTLKWLEVAKKPYIKENTYDFYLQTIQTYIIPKLGKEPIKSISQVDIQKFLNEYTEKGLNRTAEKIMMVLNQVFNYAVGEDIINKSPMINVKIGAYEQEHGVPLSREEEKAFLSSFRQDSTPNKQAYAFMLYTGIRRAELATMTIDETWVTVVSAKQRKGLKEKTRRIPISPMLRKILPLINVDGIKKIAKNTLTCKFAKAIPGHHLHDLRHTFITRCQECEIPREIVSIWAGHSADQSITTLVYTHLEQYEERQLKEIAKYDYDL